MSVCPNMCIGDGYYDPYCPFCDGDCDYDCLSSRICEKGTKSCVMEHGDIKI